MSLKQTTPPAARPVDLDDVSEYLRIDAVSEDTLLGQLLDAATAPVEGFLRRQLITATWTRKLTGFPAQDEIELERPPLQSAAIEYVDVDGATQTLSTDVYEVDTAAEPGVVRLKYNQSWPAARDQADAVTIVFIVGYGDAPSDVPERYQLALKYLVNGYYSKRLVAGSIDEGLRNLLGGRNFSFA